MATFDRTRRQVLQAAGATTLATLFGTTPFGRSGMAWAEPVKTLRWGIVGTGGIANSMAGMIKMADAAEIGAVSSRRLETARAFAETHDVPSAFDSWEEMIGSDTIDAIYVATPTSVREEICVAAAKGGKHVLGEKPFASLPSVRRIAAACRDNGVAFMDGTHFVHHPRTLDIRQRREERLGFVWSVASAFQFNLADRGNIRFNPELEPMGAIGDAGWYNMRAAVEYLPPGVVLDTASAHLRRDAADRRRDKRFGRAPFHGRFDVHLELRLRLRRGRHGPAHHRDRGRHQHRRLPQPEPRRLGGLPLPQGWLGPR